VPGVDVQAVVADQKSSAVTRQGESFDSAGVSETPTVLLGKTGSTPTRLSSAVTFDEAKLAAAIRRAGG
jgi:hypothetical protein